MLHVINEIMYMRGFVQCWARGKHSVLTLHDCHHYSNQFNTASLNINTNIATPRVLVLNEKMHIKSLEE